jgi:hypothetical protein
MKCRMWQAAAVCALFLAPAARPAAAQVPGDTVSVAAGAQYEAGRLQRLLNGSNWREAWVTPVRVPVLDIRTFAGGLTPLRRGGGNQSITLHMTDAEGRRWIFRSIDKFPGRALPPAFMNTPVGDAIQDHISALHPGAHFIMPTLLEAVRVLHVQPTLYVMPDDPALGEYREAFAGMLGEIERRANEGPDNTPGFAGSRAIKGAEAFLDDIEDSQQHLLDEREFFRARLVDMLVGDPDRGTDQWRWLRFGEEGAYTWRPLPVDRDWALIRPDGLLVRLVQGYYGKLTRFDRSAPDLTAHTFSNHILDRRLLTRLTRADAAAEAARTRAALTDEVIERAVAAMPSEYVALNGADIAATLKARRDLLAEVADAFYEYLATDVNVRGTDEDDLAEIERRPDGTVRVTIRPRPVAANGEIRHESKSTRPGFFYDRTFLPDETHEIRVYLHGGDDHARITGTPDGPITVRVIGGGSDDLLEDLAGGARFYDDRGDNTVIRAAGTRFDDKTWDEPDVPEGLRANLDWAPDWGSSRSIGPVLGHHERAGQLVGASLRSTRQGFRRLPYHWDMDLRAVYGLGTGGAALQFGVDHRMPNSRRAAMLEASASTLEEIRFRGFGNDVAYEAPATRIGSRRVGIAPSLVWLIGYRAGEEQDEREEEEQEEEEDDDVPLIRWTPPQGRQEGRIRIGPDFQWTAPRFGGAAPAADATDLATITRLGASAGFELRDTDRPAVPRRGYDVRLEASAFPLVWGNSGRRDAYGRAAASVAGYVPLMGSGPHLALRAGAQHVLGDAPLFDAVFLGGRATLRGMPTDRLAGDTGVNGTAELRVPLGFVTTLARMEAGALVFGDAGRVWHDGESPGGWHGTYGVGGWFDLLGSAVSVAIARGDETRAYAWLGLPF